MSLAWNLYGRQTLLFKQEDKIDTLYFGKDEFLRGLKVEIAMIYELGSVQYLI